MNDQNNPQTPKKREKEKVVAKAVYTKPTLIEYGSLAANTRRLNFPDLNADSADSPSITTIAI